MKLLNVTITVSLLALSIVASSSTLHSNHDKTIFQNYNKTDLSSPVYSAEETANVVYVYVENRSSYITSVYINNTYVGWLRPGAYNVFTTYPGCINVVTQWSNGYYNYWNPCLSAGATYYCYTGY